MKQLTSYFISQVLLFIVLLHSPKAVVLGVGRADFPADFVFGSGTTAYQFESFIKAKQIEEVAKTNSSGKYEGAASEDGRTPSIWDTYAHSGHTNGANGDVTCDGYHKYKEDIGLMADTGLEAFRLTLSWSRLIPNGRGPTNAKGLQFYNNLINELLSHGIQPHITLTHIDMPQALQDEYGGWLSRKVVKDFVEFADVCFSEFGDRVLHWTSINEANVDALGGYNDGFMAPGRCSVRTKCDSGDSTTEPYRVVHHMLLAHSAAAKLYKEKYKATQKGYVGLNIFAYGLVPFTNSTKDVIATKRANDFFIGWILDPLIFGDYPDIIKKRAQARLPVFTKQESEQIKGSVDFIGMNHYTTIYIKDNPSPKTVLMGFYADMAVDLIFEHVESPSYQFPVMPWGLGGVLEYLKQVYGNPPIYIHENGQMSRRNGTLNDTSRVEYIQAYIGSMLDSMRNGSNVKGYFVWSFLDCLELLDGWMSSYGLYYVDLDDKDLKRYPKLSSQWYSNFLKGKSITRPNGITQIKDNKSVSLRSKFSY